MARRAWSPALVVLLLAIACDDARQAETRRAEVERRVAEAEGATGDPAPQPPPRSSVPPAITNDPGAETAPAEDPPSAAQAAWAAALERATDAVDGRSRQM